MKVHGATYRRLPGRTMSFFGGRSSLWLAEDHVLEATGLLLAERYRRFPLVDIRAFVIEETRTQAIALWIYGTIALLGVLAVVGGVFGAAQIENREAVVGLWILGSFVGGVGFIALIGFIITLIRGATCRCWVQTAAGLRELAAPKRRRAAQRLIAELAPEIAAAQAAASR